MRPAFRTDDCRQDSRPCGTGRQPFAHHLVKRFTAAGAHDEGMTRVAIAAVAQAESLMGADRPDFAAVAVPLIIRALRRHRSEQIRNRPASLHALPALQSAVSAAEEELARRLRRSPTVDELARHLGVDEEQIVTALEVGWPACA